MAAIREELVLADRFTSTLDRYAQKLGAGARMTQAAAAIVERQNDCMAGSTQSASVRMVQSAEQASTGVSDATQSLVDRLGTVEENMRNAFTDQQGAAELNRLQNQMQRLGLVWTNTADEADAANKIMEFGLKTLAQKGRLTADTLAEGAYQEKAAMQAAAQQAQLEKESRRAAAQQTQAALAALRQQSQMTKAALREQARQARETAREAAEQSRIEQEAADRAAEAERRHAESVRTVKSAIGGVISFLPKHAAGLIKSSAAASKARAQHNALGKQLLRTAAYMFSVRRIFGFLSESIERAPKGIQKSWNGMVNGVKDTFARGFVSMLGAMQPAIDRFNAFMKSPAGQRFARGLETAMGIAGNAVGWLLDKVTALGTWIGDNFSTVMAVAGVLLAVFAGQMLFAAVATMAANWPLLLLIGLATALVVGLQAAGFTSEEIFAGIGQGLGWLYALAYNLIVDAWNTIAVFAEFFANVFNDPVGAIARLFFGVFDSILGIVETVAGAIDALLGSNMAGAVSGFRSDMQKWVDDKFGENQIRIDRMEKIDYLDTMDTWGKEGAKIATEFSLPSLDSKLTPYLAKIDTNTAKTAKNTADASDEDLKYLEDVAVRRYETHVNTTSLTPSITVNVKGGADKEGAQDIAAAIATILVQQAASHTSLSYAEVGV